MPETRKQLLGRENRRPRRREFERQWKVVQAVAEFGTLAKAAEELAVSQSAVSRAISLLEKEIGVDLFTRRGRANELNRF